MDNTLSIKFNPSHIQLPKNIKYLYHTNILVSERAVGIYKHDSQYRSQINKLDNIVFVYNSVFNNLYIFEDLLINERIGRLEKILSSESASSSGDPQSSTASSTRLTWRRRTHKR